MDVCLTHITSSVSPVRDLQQGLVELQRSWLTLQAIFDYLDTFAALMRGEGRANTATVFDHMGAFVWDVTRASMLFRAGLPVYFVWPYSSFHHQVIQWVVSLTQPGPPKICITQARPPYLPIVTTQAGSEEKFAAICIAAINCFLDNSPFANSHYPEAYQSSHHLGIDCIISLVQSDSSVCKAGVRSTSIIRTDCAGRVANGSPYKNARRSVLGKPRISKDVGRESPLSSLKSYSCKQITSSSTPRRAQSIQ